MADKVLPFEFVLSLSLSPALCSDGNADFHGYFVSILLLIHLLWSVITVKYPFLTPMFNFPRVETLYCFNKLQTNQQDQWKHSLPQQNKSDYFESFFIDSHTIFHKAVHTI